MTPRILFATGLSQDPVDQAIKEVPPDNTEDKSMTFTTFVKIQAFATKLTRNGSALDGLNLKTMKCGVATMVPQVKQINAGNDPSLAHLL